ncbi:maleylpyruvate isomerase family mycothiol-dependent enzyme [Kitasatospora sp. NPDC101183]|uniref:maleylpyruvate isomerase family mycothiol-dependent enzyme n=1 Tax=Kitasatospora sp. NPDC101183 TaxID=3364100 RepID=UPI0038251B59
MTDPQSAADSWLKQVEEATARLLATLAGMDPEAVAEPSGLPGWTRGHVLAHLARNADSLVNLLHGLPQYAGGEARDADIERDAPRPLDVHLADLRDSHARFAAAAAATTAEFWGSEVRHRSGYLFPAYEIPLKRLIELEFHHVDLAAGYTPAQWPEDFALAQFRRLADSLADEADLPAVSLSSSDTADRAVIGSGTPSVTVNAPVRALAAWLSGRSDGTDLRADAPLPQLPPMG